MWRRNLWRQAGTALLMIAVFVLAGPVYAQGPTQWPDDDRLNPHPAEYYTVYCENDLVRLFLADGTLINEVPIPDVLELSAEGGTMDVGLGMTVMRSDDLIAVSGTNGNFSGFGVKTFSLTDCLTRNGILLAYYTPRAAGGAAAASAAGTLTTTATTTTATTTTVTTSGAYRVHVVRSGENLFRISLRYGVPVETLAALNGITNISLIYIGQVLLIP